MKEPQGFIGTIDYINSAIQKDGFYLVAFATPAPGIGDGKTYYQFTVNHNIPGDAVANFMFHVTGHLFNGREPEEESKKEGESK